MDVPGVLMLYSKGLIKEWRLSVHQNVGELFI